MRPGVARLLLLLLAARGALSVERGAVATAARSNASVKFDPLTPSPECSVAPEYLGGGALPASERILVSLTSSGRARSFLLVIPANASGPLPLLLAISGAQDDAAKLLNVSDVYPEGPDAVHIDAKATAAGFVVLAPNSECNVVNCVWGDTSTALDPAGAVGEVVTNGCEVAFVVDAVRCVSDVLQVPLSGDVYALGFSQGAKLASRFGCEGSAASGGALRVRAVAAAESLFAQPDAASCASGSADTRPPPLLLFQAQNDPVVPFCVPGAFYEATSVYFNKWATGFDGCRSSSTPLSSSATPPVLQALCAPGAATLSGAAVAHELVADATRLLRVYTNGFKWYGRASQPVLQRR